MFLIHCGGDGGVNIYEIPDNRHYSTIDAGDGLYSIYDDNRLVARYTIVNNLVEGTYFVVLNKSTSVKYSIESNIIHGQCIIQKHNTLIMREYNHDVLQPGEWVNKKGTSEWILKGRRETVVEKKKSVNYKHKR
jgi:hypothetical protein